MATASGVEARAAIPSSLDFRRMVESVTKEIAHELNFVWTDQSLTILAVDYYQAYLGTMCIPRTACSDYALGGTGQLRFSCKVPDLTGRLKENRQKLASSIVLRYADRKLTLHYVVEGDEAAAGTRSEPQQVPLLNATAHTHRFSEPFLEAACQMDSRLELPLGRPASFSFVSFPSAELKRLCSDMALTKKPATILVCELAVRILSERSRPPFVKVGYIALVKKDPLSPQDEVRIGVRDDHPVVVSQTTLVKYLNSASKAYHLAPRVDCFVSDVPGVPIVLRYDMESAPTLGGPAAAARPPRARVSFYLATALSEHSTEVVPVS